ncbi:MAG: S8 family serine peptidase, partial [Solirubrobacteraceae bacterium]
MRPAPRFMVPRTTGHARGLLLGTLASAAFLAAPAPASAALRAVGADPVHTAARVVGTPVAATELPGATASRLGRTAGTDRWLVGVRGDHRRVADLVRRAGGRFDGSLGFASVPIDRATRLARQLGPQLRWAGPDVKGRRLSSFEQPGGVISPWSRSVGDVPSLDPADGTLAPIGIVDDAVSHQVQELSRATIVNHARAGEAHGTMVASVAAAPWNGVGVVGVAPRAPLLSWGTSFYCGDVSDGIITLVRRGAKVINLSLGFPQNCFTLWNAISYAYARGVAVVAAAGNDGDVRNTLTYPASYPHVITAAAIDSGLAPASFSNYDDYVDVAAPGVDVPVDVPKKLDHGRGRGKPYDGLAAVSGTSFAAPYVSGAMSWLLGARPGLDPGQAEAILRESSRDLADPG